MSRSEAVFADGALADQIQAAIDEAFGAGVAEGIRQAREAVANVAEAASADWSPTRAGSADALSAIDSLETT